MAKAPTKTNPAETSATQSSGAQSSGLSPPSSGRASATSFSGEAARIEDVVEADVSDAAGVVKSAAAKTLGAMVQPSASIASISTPEAAMVALKDRVGLLHKIVHDASHVGSLAIVEAEHLINDMRFLFSYIHTKL